jgi:hypothetical protein
MYAKMLNVRLREGQYQCVKAYYAGELYVHHMLTTNGLIVKTERAWSVSNKHGLKMLPNLKTRRAAVDAAERLSRIAKECDFDMNSVEQTVRWAWIANEAFYAMHTLLENALHEEGSVA